MFTVNEIESRIRGTYNYLQAKRMDLAEKVLLNQSTEYTENLVKENETLLEYWKAELIKAKAWQFTTA